MGLYLQNGITGFRVERPLVESLYSTLKKEVLPCRRDTINKMKQNVIDMSSKLDYHAYVRTLATFVDNLK